MNKKEAARRRAARHRSRVARQRRGRLLWQLGTAAMICVVPLAIGFASTVFTTKAMAEFITLLSLIFLPAVVGFPLLVVGRLLGELAVPDNDVLRKRFIGVPILRWPVALGETGLAVCAKLLSIAGPVALFVGVANVVTGDAINLDTPVAGSLGAGALLSALVVMIVAGVWMLLGVSVAAPLLIGYAVSLLVRKGARRSQARTARTIVSTSLIVVGVAAVATGSQGYPSGDPLLRGLITTAGAVLFVVPVALAMVSTWSVIWPRATGFRSVVLAIAQLIVLLVLPWWVISALVTAWSP